MSAVKYSNRSGRDEHVKIAEKALGRSLPPGVIVHHADGNPLNNRNDNLVICPNEAYHKFLHVRMAAYEACGDVNARKCSLCKVYDKQANLRLAKKSTHSEGQWYHWVCKSTYDSARYLKRKEALE